MAGMEVAGSAAESFPFQNCSGFTNTQLQILAFARGLTAVVCCAVLLTVLLLLLVLVVFTQQRNRLCGSAVKRLTIGLIAVNAAYQLPLALHLIHYYDPKENVVCIVDGFFDQYLASIQLYLTLGIFLVLFIKVLKVSTSWKRVDGCYEKTQANPFTCCGLKISRLEITIFTSVCIFPLLYVWVPFVTDSYGPYGGWCWIRSFDKNCSTHIAGMWEHIWIWYVPFGIVAFLTTLLFVASLCLLGYRIKNTQVERTIVVGIVDSVISLAVMCVLRILQTIAYFCEFKQGRFVFRVLHGIAAPLSAFIPLALLMTIHLPLSSVIVGQKRQRRQSFLEDDCATAHNKTNHDSSDWSVIHQPSHTTWNPPHSTNQVSETTPLARDQPVQNYGINVNVSCG